MKQEHDIHPAFIGLLAALVVFLLGVFGFLFAPSAPTADVQPTAIPLENASSLTSPGQIQGNTATNPQNAAQVQPGDLDSVNPS